MIPATWPKDTQGELSTFCKIPIDSNDLRRFAAIAQEDLAVVFQSRPELKELRFITVLAEDAGEHYANGTGFRCISLWTFFAKAQGVRQYHPLRHKRIDFGSSKFGHSSWVKTPSDIGFIGRGINLFGRSIDRIPGETIEQALTHYVQTAKTDGATRLRDKTMVILWPNDKFGETLLIEEIQLRKRARVSED
jgi:hypothetical protein